MRVRGVDVVGEPEAQDGDEGLHAVLPADLLPLLVGAPRVADRDLEDARLALRELDGQLGLEPEVVRDDRDRLEQRRCGRPCSRSPCPSGSRWSPVGEEREEPVAELVTEEQRAPRLAAREARAEDRVGLLLDEDLHDAEQVARVVLEVRVVDDRELARPPRRARCGSPCPSRRSSRGAGRPTRSCPRARGREPDAARDGPASAR